MEPPPIRHIATYEDDRRARELFHYFQPDNPALLPSSDRAAGLTDSSSSSKKASPNLVLTALTQLAAIKLGVQRAIISLIDRETLYVVAEASKSLNLANNEVYENDGDGLWMGCSHGPVAGTLCEKTVTLKPTLEERYPLFVVKDLRQHPVYNNIPCVCGPPFFRYYAGTPLTTSNGITIGSLYVIDPRPDITLSPSHVETLGAIADAVMEYLETSRQSLESHRLAKVLSGLNSFVQGDDGEDSPTSTFKNGSPSGRASSRMSSPQESPTRGNHNFDLHGMSDTSSLRSASPGHNADVPETVLEPPRSPKSTNFEVPVIPSAKRRANKTRSTFQRAANLMRESLDLGQDGGVVILDSSEHSELDSLDDLDREKERKSASVCALAVKEPFFEDSTAASHSPIAPQLDLHFVRRMVRRYPRGGLWYFYQDGTAFSSDDDAISSESEIAISNSTARSQQSVHPRSFGTLREKDLQTLRKYFPRATRIVFAPLWDSFNSRWFGGCFGWSAMETRVFSAHVELGGVFGFGSSMMVEHSRAQSQESDRKKGDFISSISHELRSPLHGILAATDFLSEHVETEFAKSLLDTVRACGQTLLDTFEQILDYSKINSLDVKRQLHSSRLRTDRGRNEKSRSEALKNIKVVHIGAVVEDVIESVYSGHIFYTNLASGAWQLEPGEDNSGASDGSSTSPIDILIDVAPHNWEFMIEPGALRRIIMNVFGNALKYTQGGFVSVRVEIQRKCAGMDSMSSSDNSGSEIVVLTVSDTGKGISNEYLRTNIFTPFSQEDTLSPGTGLGLSLVRSILRSLNGTIKIKSQVGIGTVVKIVLPLARPQNRDSPSPPSFPTNSSLRGSTDVVERLRTAMKWKTLSLLPGGETHSPSSLHIIRDYLTEWFGLRLQSWDSDVRSDFILVKESELEALPRTLDHSSVIVLCQRGPGLSSIRAGASGLSAKLIQLTLPCGPYRLARVLLEATEIVKRGTSPTYNGLSPDLSQVVLQESDLQCSAAATTHGPHSSDFTETIISEPSLATLANVSKTVEGSDVITKKKSETGIRILLVEDNPINMALLKKFVNRKLPQVLHTAVNGKLAVERVQNTMESYHYIFMDMSMPVMDGFEATQAIRSIERNRCATHPATIIALTGLGSSEHIAKAYAAGINVFLTKPVSFNDIERLMDERNLLVK